MQIYSFAHLVQVIALLVMLFVYIPPLYYTIVDLWKEGDGVVKQGTGTKQGSGQAP